VCEFLVDTWRLGVKNALGPKPVERRKLPSFCADAFRSYPGAPVEVPLVLVHQIVFGAIRYARGLGFEPHADFAKAAGHLGERDGVCDLEFGRDGMPMYIEGPHDDTWHIIHTLRQNIGGGNFHYLVGLQSLRHGNPRSLRLPVSEQPRSSRIRSSGFSGYMRSRLERLHDERCEPISWRYPAEHVSCVPWPQEQEAEEGAEVPAAASQSRGSA
jgi:hypothetical protein